MQTEAGNAPQHGFHGGAMADGDGCSMIQRSSALFDKQKAWEEREAQREVKGMDCGAREGSKGGVIDDSG